MTVPWEDVFKFSASAAASEFCDWIRVGINAYITHHKYQVKPHSCPWFSAAYAAAILHGNHFLQLCQQNKSSESKRKFRQVSNHSKMVHETANLAYAHKTKGSTITSQKPGSWEFWRNANSVLNNSAKVNLLYLLYYTARKYCFLHLIKKNCLLKTFLSTLILMT